MDCSSLLEAGQRKKKTRTKRAWLSERDLTASHTPSYNKNFNG